MQPSYQEHPLSRINELQNLHNGQNHNYVSALTYKKPPPAYPKSISRDQNPFSDSAASREASMKSGEFPMQQQQPMSVNYEKALINSGIVPYRALLPITKQSHQPSTILPTRSNSTMSAHTAARHQKDQNQLNRRINDTLDLQLVDAYATGQSAYPKNNLATFFHRLKQNQINSIRNDKTNSKKKLKQI